MHVMRTGCASGFEKPNPEASDGRRFLALKTTRTTQWGAVGGSSMPASILLQPDYCLSTKCLVHPCHVAGNRPEQDYLSRFFAADFRREISLVSNQRCMELPVASISLCHGSGCCNGEPFLEGLF